MPCQPSHTRGPGADEYQANEAEREFNNRTARYTQEHYMDVAAILQCHCVRPCLCPRCGVVRELASMFADLFAADNPPTCQHKGHLAPCGELCLAGGFNRAQFLGDCKLEVLR